MVPKKGTPNARAPPRRASERITVRLNAQDVNGMDALIHLGEFDTRSDVIKRALRELVLAYGAKIEEHQKRLDTLQKLGALAQQMSEFQQK